MILLAVDPSIRSSGIAVFTDDVLTYAGRIVVKPTGRIGPGDILERAVQMGDTICTRMFPILPDIVAVEWPQIYRGPKSKGDPNDLPGLACVAGAIAARFPGATLAAYTPAEWAGQIPKVTIGNALESVRAKRILSRLSCAERKLVPAQHDVIDAVGIGLFHLSRLAPRRAHAGATR